MVRLKDNESYFIIFEIIFQTPKKIVLEEAYRKSSEAEQKLIHKVKLGAFDGPKNESIESRRMRRQMAYKLYDSIEKIALDNTSIPTQYKAAKSEFMLAIEAKKNINNIIRNYKEPLLIDIVGPNINNAMLKKILDKYTTNARINNLLPNGGNAIYVSGCVYASQINSLKNDIITILSQIPHNKNQLFISYKFVSTAFNSDVVKEQVKIMPMSEENAARLLSETDIIFTQPVRIV